MFPNQNPYGFPMHPFMQQMMPIMGMSPREAVPQRVQVALQVLTELNVKTMTRIAVHSVGMDGSQDYKGDDLTSDEKDLHTIACTCISHFLLNKGEDEETDEVTMICPNCRSQGQTFAQPSCRLCKGKGWITVAPSDGE